MEKQKRKYYLDNIRWITIMIVVVFHIFYYYHNLGVDAMFAGLPQSDKVTFASLFQYGVYQWFMVLLFLVSGICARYSLEKKTAKEFHKERVHKLLVPSTLGIITIQWIGGYIISLSMMSPDEAAAIPVAIRFMIMVLSGTGALWFCQVLYVACLILLLVKKIDKKNKLLELGGKANLIVIMALVVVLIGMAQILNVPMIPTYRMGYFVMAFLFGYYVFSNESSLELLKKWWILLLTVGAVFGIIYIKLNYGTYYADYEVLNHPVSILHGYFTAIGIIGVSQVILNFENKFTSYMSKAGWGIYICHINVLLLVNTLLKPVAGTIPMIAIYVIELTSALIASILLWEVFRRVPVIRWLLFGIRKEEKNV